MDRMNLFDVFLRTHKVQLESSGVPQFFWEVLFFKLKYEVFDSDQFFQMGKMQYEHTKRHVTEPLWKLFVTADGGISAREPTNIFLIDHAWTYDARSAHQNLAQTPRLLNRMCSFMGIDMEMEEQEKIKSVMCEMWRYNQSFSINYEAIEDRMPIWYIMDEVGLAINHSNKPNFRAVPFLYAPKAMTYTLLFPVKDVAMGEEVTRDFVEGQTSDPEKRRALLLPWVDSSFDDVNCEQTEPDDSYFTAGRICESIPEDLETFSYFRDKWKVFTEHSILYDYLTEPIFQLTDKQSWANIYWLMSHYKTYGELSSRPFIFVNQFPCEYVLTVKDLLSIVCRRRMAEGDNSHDPDTLGTYPAWLPVTYNLSTELTQFVAYYTRRANKQLDNYWICKPWNLARGLDTYITDNLYHILRLPCTGPKIAQRYITRPVLYERLDIGRVKFDIRYVLLLKSVRPLCAYAYTNFFLRFANLPFTLDRLQEYEQHFTVMNYNDENQLCHVKCADFVVEWERQYPNYPWETYVKPRILSVLRQVFEAAVARPPPRGIAKSPQSRAVYAADLMLEWRDTEMQPMLLEVNFMPDCRRACEYYPDFYNDVFKCLFLNIDNPELFHMLKPLEEEDHFARAQACVE